MLRGDALLARLRGDSAERPAVDPGVAPGLRDWLEDGLAAAVASLPDDHPPVRVSKDTVSQVLLCEAHHLATRRARRAVTPELARGLLVDAVFRTWITTGSLGDPLADATNAVAVSGDPDGVAGYVEALDEAARQALSDELCAHAARIADSWPVPSPSWMARTQERLVVPLAGGRVVLSGVIDLAFGAPSSGRASVCIVEAKSGRRRVEHRGDLHLYALLETLRSGAPPFRVATYYSATGELDVEPVGRDVLLGALHRVLPAAVRLCRLAAGSAPERTPNPLCGRCPGLPDCAPGRRRVDRGPGTESSWD